MVKNILLTMEYDGSAFHGWQEQEGLRTVQGEIQEALLQVTGQSIRVAGTSRTDAGVHARGQCCSFKADLGIPTERLPRALNNILSGGRYGAGSRIGAIRVLAAREMAEDFHARFNCVGKTYKYLLSCAEPSVFTRDRCYYVDGPLNVEAMKKAASYIVGTHDFACFQSAGGTPRESTVRTVTGLDIDTYYDDMVIAVTGDGFLYNMVRIIIGTLIEVGQGKRDPESLPDTLASLDRSRAGHTAPAHGLYLDEIYFSGAFADAETDPDGPGEAHPSASDKSLSEDGDRT